MIIYASSSKTQPLLCVLRNFYLSMNRTKQPTKEHIRQWLMDRQRHPRPLPTMEQVKSELGWRASNSREAHSEAVAKTNCFDDQST